MVIKERVILVITIGFVLGLIFALSENYLYFDKPSRSEENPIVFNEILNEIQSKYIDKVDYDVLIKSAVTGILSDLDEHSEILSADDYRQVKNSTKGMYTGIGITIYNNSNKGLIKVVNNQSSAFVSGVRPGDEILMINGQPIENLTFIELSQLIKGQAGTNVKLVIKKVITEEIMSLNLMRENIFSPSIDTKILPSQYCYIKLDKFNNQTQVEINNDMNNICLAKKSNINVTRGLIIDIRDNPGGTLEGAVKVANLFLEKGVIVSAKGRKNDSLFVHSADANDITKGLPIVIIVNKYSASAAEIFAGAMQDNNRAIIVGTSTYGKGLIQTVIPLTDGSAIKLTTAQYFRPSGSPITKSGIRPDIVIKNTESASKNDRDESIYEDLQLSEAINIMNNRLEYNH
jgi:carboxyl-terminal processing protease